MEQRRSSQARRARSFGRSSELSYADTDRSIIHARACSHSSTDRDPDPGQRWYGMAVLLALRRDEAERYRAAERALKAGRPSVHDPLLDAPLYNPYAVCTSSSLPDPVLVHSWDFPASFVRFIGKPATRRNFFVLHEHAATAYHWDLRLACALSPGQDGTLSWAIPRGFSDWEGGRERRLAIETPIHSISYSCFEGCSTAGFGSTLIADFGTYSVKTSLAGMRKGRDDERDTPDPEDEGEEEEAALREAYSRKGIVLLLQGKRYTIRLALKYSNAVATGTGMKKQWMASLAPEAEGKYIYQDRFPQLKNRSIITGRSMDEVKADGGSLFPMNEEAVHVENLEGMIF